MWFVWCVFALTGMSTQACVCVSLLLWASSVRVSRASFTRMDTALRMKEANRFMWMLFLIQWSFLVAEVSQCVRAFDFHILYSLLCMQQHDQFFIYFFLQFFVVSLFVLRFVLLTFVLSAFSFFILFHLHFVCSGSFCFSHSHISPSFLPSIFIPALLSILHPSLLRSLVPPIYLFSIILPFLLFLFFFLPLIICPISFSLSFLSCS